MCSDIYEKSFNDLISLSSDYNNLGIILREQGDFEGSLAALNDGLEIDRRISNHLGIAKKTAEKSFTFQTMGKHIEGILYLSTAVFLVAIYRIKQGVKKIRG